MAQAADEARAMARAQDDLASDRIVATAAAAQRSRGKKASVAIMMSVNAHHGAKLRRYTSSRHLWAALAAELKPKRSARAIKLRRQVNTISMEGGESLVRHFNLGWELLGHLSEKGIEIDDHHLLSVLLLGRTPRFELTAEVMQNNRHLTLLEALEHRQTASDGFALKRAKGKRNSSEAKESEGVALAAGTPAAQTTSRTRVEMSAEERKDRFKIHT